MSCPSSQVVFTQVGLTAEEAKEELESVWDTDPELKMSDDGTFVLREPDEVDFDSDSEEEEGDDVKEDDLGSKKRAELAVKFQPFGPPAILVAGFREHELGLVQPSFLLYHIRHRQSDGFLH